MDASVTLKGTFLSVRTNLRAKTKAIGAGSAMAGVLYVDARLAGRSPVDGHRNSRNGDSGGVHGAMVHA
jgi:hypothetical protein